MWTRPVISRPGETVAAKLGNSESCVSMRGLFWLRGGHFAGFTYVTPRVVPSESHNGSGPVVFVSCGGVPLAMALGNCELS